MQLSVRRPWSMSSGEVVEVVVVIDVLRATTTAAFLVDRGDEVIVMESPADLASLSPVDDYTVFSELELPPGWRHVDNSPAFARTGSWSGRPVLVTTNGTRAIHAALAIAGEVVLASFVNIAAVAQWIRDRAPENLVIAPAGFEPRREPRHEDDACAAALGRVLHGSSSTALVADAARGCWQDARVARRLDRNPGLRADFELALSPDLLHCVPLAVREREHVLIRGG